MSVGAVAVHAHLPRQASGTAKRDACPDDSIAAPHWRERAFPQARSDECCKEIGSACSALFYSETILSPRLRATMPHPASRLPAEGMRGRVPGRIGGGRSRARGRPPSRHCHFAPCLERPPVSPRGSTVPWGKQGIPERSIQPCRRDAEPHGSGARGQTCRRLAATRSLRSGARGRPGANALRSEDSASRLHGRLGCRATSARPDDLSRFPCLAPAPARFFSGQDSPKERQSTKKSWRAAGGPKGRVRRVACQTRRARPFGVRRRSPRLIHRVWGKGWR